MSDYFSKAEIESKVVGYKIIKSIKRSGCAETFLASMKGRKVVLKIFKKSFPMKRVDREKDMSQKVEDENVVKFIEFKKVEDITYMAMEYVDGSDLSTKIGNNWKPKEKEIINLLIGYASGLDALKQKIIVHRDIKPGNLMITQEGKPVIIDLGVAKDYQRETIITEYSRWHPGTAPYMSPEQIAGGHLDFRSDLFSLGISLFEVITGNLPFDGETVEDIMEKISNKDYIAPRITKYREDLSESLVDVFEKILNKKPTKRYRKLGALLMDLKNVSDNLENPKDIIKRGSYFLHIGNSFNFLDKLLKVDSPDGIILSASSSGPTSIRNILKKTTGIIKDVIFDNEAYRTSPGGPNRLGCTSTYLKHDFAQIEKSRKKINIDNITSERWKKDASLRRDYVKSILEYQKKIGCTIFLPPYFHISSINDGFLDVTIDSFRDAQIINLQEKLDINKWAIGVFINGSEILEENKRDILLTSITSIDADIVYLQVDAKLEIEDSMMSSEMLKAVSLIIDELENNDMRVLLSYVDWEGFGFLSNNLSALANGVTSGKRSISIETRGFRQKGKQIRIERFELPALLSSLRHPGELDSIIQSSKNWKKIKCNCCFCKQQPLFKGVSEVIDGKLKDAHSALIRIQLSNEMKELALEGRKKHFNDKIRIAISNHEALEDENLVKLKGKSGMRHLQRWLDFISS